MRGASSFSLVSLGMVVLLASAGLPMQGFAKLSARPPIASAHGGSNRPGESIKIPDLPVQEETELKIKQDSRSMKKSSGADSAHDRGVPKDLPDDRTTEHGPKEPVQLLPPSYTKRVRVINDTPLTWNFTARYFEDPVPKVADALEKARYRYDVELAGGESYLFPERIEKVGTYFIVIPVRHIMVNTAEGLEFDTLNLDKHVVGVHSEVSVTFRSPAAEKPPALFYSDL